MLCFARLAGEGSGYNLQKPCVLGKKKKIYLKDEI